MENENKEEIERFEKTKMAGIVGILGNIILLIRLFIKFCSVELYFFKLFDNIFLSILNLLLTSIIIYLNN